MANSLPSLVNNLAEGIHKIKRKNEQDNKNVNLLELNTNIATIFFNINILKMIGYNTNDYVVRKIIKKSLMKS